MVGRDELNWFTVEVVGFWRLLDLYLYDDHEPVGLDWESKRVQL